MEIKDVAINRKMSVLVTSFNILILLKKMELQ